MPMVNMTPEAYRALTVAYDFTVTGSGPLYGYWQGWRIAGTELISPDGDRVSLTRLRGLMFREASRHRPSKQQGNVFPFRTGAASGEPLALPAPPLSEQGASPTLPGALRPKQARRTDSHVRGQ